MTAVAFIFITVFISGGNSTCCWCPWKSGLERQEEDGDGTETECDQHKEESHWSCQHPLQVRLDLRRLSSFFFRYRDTWTPWRQCSNAAARKEEMLELDALNKEGIRSFAGFCYDDNGHTLSLEASTTAGRSWGPHGDHTAYASTSFRSLRNSPDAKLRLRFISGDQTEFKWILR